MRTQNRPILSTKTRLWTTFSLQLIFSGYTVETVQCSARPKPRGMTILTSHGPEDTQQPQTHWNYTYQSFVQQTLNLCFTVSNQTPSLCSSKTDVPTLPSCTSNVNSSVFWFHHCSYCPDSQNGLIPHSPGCWEWNPGLTRHRQALYCWATPPVLNSFSVLMYLFSMRMNSI